MTPTHPLRCDAPNCEQEIIMRHQGEQYCWGHALERGKRGCRLVATACEREGRA